MSKEMSEDTKKKISSFFDEMCNDHFEFKMAKYVDMEKLEKDFIEGVWKTKCEYEESEKEGNEMLLCEFVIDNVPFWFNCFDGCSELISDAEYKIETFIENL